MSNKGTDNLSKHIAQVVPIRGSKDISNGGDRRSSYNIEAYQGVQSEDMKDIEQIDTLGFVLDRIVIVLVVIYTLLVFISFAFTTNDANENDDIATTLFVVTIIEICILGLFCIEIMMRTIQTSFKSYFSDYWQIFDAIVIIASIVLIILDWVLQDNSFKTVSKVIRGVFRFLRLFLVFRKFNQVKKISDIGRRYKVRSPVEKVLELLRDMQEQFDDPQIITELKWAVGHISNNTLYDPIMDRGNAKMRLETMLLIQGQGNLIEGSDTAIDVNENAEFLLDVATINLPSSLELDFQENILKLEYDYFGLHKKVGNQMLPYLINYLFKKHDLFNQLRISPISLNSSMEDVAKGYNSNNPYHNVIHAFDVTHTVHFYVEQCQFKEVGKLNKIDLAILFVAAAGHDLGHPGFNNIYLVNTRDPLALNYNDRSPLENYHASSLLTTLKQHSVLKLLTISDYKYFRDRTINMILSTDNAQHGKDYNKLKARLASTDFEPHGKDKSICMDAMLHGADISNPFKPWNNCYQWTLRVLDEFWNQGDSEKQLGLPITMLCDRQTTNTAKSQIGFIEFMVLPYYDTLALILPALVPFNKQIQENKKVWSEKVEYYQEELNKINN